MSKRVVFRTVGASAAVVHAPGCPFYRGPAAATSPQKPAVPSRSLELARYVLELEKNRTATAEEIPPPPSMLAAILRQRAIEKRFALRKNSTDVDPCVEAHMKRGLRYDME